MGWNRKQAERKHLKKKLSKPKGSGKPAPKPKPLKDYYEQTS